MTAVFASAQAELPGDVNGSGTVEAEDALLILRRALGVSRLDPSVLPIADMNENGTIDVFDALPVMRYALDYSNANQQFFAAVALNNARPPLLWAALYWFKGRL